MNAFVQWLKDLPRMTLLIIRSRTVIAFFASAVMSYCIGKNWIPQNLFTQGVDCVIFIVGVYFRATATVDIAATAAGRTAVSLAPAPPPPSSD